jgi:hypothetical protein
MRTAGGRHGRSHTKRTPRAPARARLPLLRFRPGGVGLDGATRGASIQCTWSRWAQGAPIKARHRLAQPMRISVCHTSISPGMLNCMKTTLNVSDALLYAAKQRAAVEGRTLTSLFEEALRMRLATAPADSTAQLRLPTWNGGSAAGYRVDIEDKDALLNALDRPS